MPRKITNTRLVAIKKHATINPILLMDKIEEEIKADRIVSEYKKKSKDVKTFFVTVKNDPHHTIFEIKEGKDPDITISNYIQRKRYVI
jgi:hypothetical protein